ncbi:hypothetical protein TELCIR_00688 [Teladorsagia circumcincta]|uniref:Uncharacterized protein n=1 Tax=Teladorsagia circumcincta TaxID=45464 RepID=A0A2G9V5J9_TELCI|nr:hypothetical protein TELCIR_00688 [Teladorsagia circumcincta]
MEHCMVLDLSYMGLSDQRKEGTQASRTRLEHSALDLRIESLNCVATNHAARPFVFTGGQAGLMFIRPCAIDTEVPLISDLFPATPGESSSKRQKHAAKAAAE